MARMRTDDGVLRVAEGSELESLTTQGWRMLQVLPESREIVSREEVPLVLPGQNYPTTYSGTRAQVVQQHRFLMLKEERTVLAEAQARFDAVTADNQKKTAALLEAEKKAKEQAAQWQRICEENKRYLEQTVALREEVATMRGQRDKMEKDIGKVRAAVGELKMKEILSQ
jgi:hypothetical protein